MNFCQGFPDTRKWFTGESLYSSFAAASLLPDFSVPRSLASKQKIPSSILKHTHFTCILGYLTKYTHYLSIYYLQYSILPPSLSIYLSISIRFAAQVKYQKCVFIMCLTMSKWRHFLSHAFQAWKRLIVRVETSPFWYDEIMTHFPSLPMGVLLFILDINCLTWTKVLDC